MSSHSSTSVILILTICKYYKTDFKSLYVYVCFILDFDYTYTYTYTYINKEKEMTHVFAILDRSGSMTGLESDTIKGYNQFIKGLKGKIKVSLTLFDHEILDVYYGAELKDVPKLDNKTYITRGWTALIDAVCKTLNSSKSDVKKGDKAIVLIITDGLENSSREYTSEQMKDLIVELEGKDNWTFTYLGANQDSWGVAKKWGFKEGNVANFHATQRGTAQVFHTMSMNTTQFAASGAVNSKQFYSEKDKEKLDNAK